MMVGSKNHAVRCPHCTAPHEITEQIGEVMMRCRPETLKAGMSNAYQTCGRYFALRITQVQKFNVETAKVGEFN